MKRLLCIILALIACLMLTAVMASADAATEEDTDIDVSVYQKCTHCNKSVIWNTLTQSTKLPTTAGTHHYKLTSAITPSQLTVPAGVTLCLDLKGHSINTNGRAIIVSTGSTLNILDSSKAGTGYISGSTGGNNHAGGTITVQEDATLNLRSGTLKFTNDGVGSTPTHAGCVISMRGTMAMYGGKIEGGELAFVSGKDTAGGAIHVGAVGKLTVSGGTITSGTLPEEGGVGACVYLSGTGSSLTLTAKANIEEIYSVATDNITVIGTYTGNATVALPDSLPVSMGDTVGISHDAEITGKLQCIAGGSVYGVAADGSNLVLTATTDIAAVHAGGTLKSYSTLQAAVSNAGSGYVKLLNPSDEDISPAKDLYLDLNGCDLTGRLTVSDGATLYCMDSQTDDYTVKDGVYGKLTNVSGTVAGIPEESTLVPDGYLMITENDGISFHRVNLALNAMTLRPEKAGVYYKSAFAGDEMVAAQVSKYGVALSVTAIPTAENLTTDCKLSRQDIVFSAGGMDADATSTLLKGIMKDTNATMINNRNASLPVYGRAYIQLSDGSYLFGAAAQRSFREQVEGVDDRWSTLSDAQKASTVAMYEKFRDIMRNWDIPNVIAQKDPSTDGIMKILGIGNSYTIDSMHLLNAVYQAEKPGTKLQLGIAYYSGCTLASHVKFYNQESAVYTYYYLDSETGSWVTTKNMTLQDIITAQNWDLVSMQQGSGSSGVASTYNSDIRTIQGFVDELLGYTPTFFWNMTWAYPETDIPTDSYTLDNAPNANSFKNNYGSSQETMYQMIMETVQAKIVPDSTFHWIMPVGTAVQNAQSSYMTDLDLYRDYTHLSDFARLMAAYTWYCQLEGTTLDSVKLTKVPDALTKSYTASGDMVLTENQINVLVESVKNAATTKFQVTQSQYTTEG